MNPEEELALLEDLLDQLVKGIQDAIQSGEVLSDEFQGLLAQEIGQTMDRITSLQEELQDSQLMNQAEGIPTPPGADLLWILAGGNSDAFVNYLRTYPDAGLNSLLSNPTLLNQVIEQLSRLMPQGEGEVKDGIQEAPLDSSNVYGYQYDPKSGRLKVRFQSGSVYEYGGVPAGVFKVFQQGAVPAKTTGKNRYGQWWTGKIPSLGAAFYSLIRQGGYPYQRLK
jgi:hypothetical protein